MKRALALLLVFLAGTAAADTFTATSSMSVERSLHTATVLQDGRIFIAGGSSDPVCEIFDPATRTFRRTAALSHSRNSHTATLLQDGRVLIAGGRTVDGLDNTAELFDPRTETISPAGTMISARYEHSAVLLPDGRVLLTGGGEAYNSGFSISYRPQARAEIYNPLTNTFTAAPDMKTPRWKHTSTLLGDNTVLVVGLPLGAAPGLPAAEIFVPASNTFHDAAGATGRSSHTATLLNDGRVLLAGGNDGSPTGLANAELYQQPTGQFQSVTAPTTGFGAAATRMGDGRVLLAGWDTSGSDTSAAAIHDPVTNRISATASMTSSRIRFAAAPLPDGSVLVVGGATATAEIFDPKTTTATAARRRAARH